ncbi:hypothetical protein MUK42_27420, partial [Musa troglodytarum]
MESTPTRRRGLQINPQRLFSSVLWTNIMFVWKQGEIRIPHCRGGCGLINRTPEHRNSHGSFV